MRRGLDRFSQELSAEPNRCWDYRQRLRHQPDGATRSATDGLCLHAPGNEALQQREEERLAEAAKRRFRLQIEGTADDVLIVFIENDLVPQRQLQSGTALFHVGYLGGEPPPRRFLASEEVRIELTTYPLPRWSLARFSLLSSIPYVTSPSRCTGFARFAFCRRRSPSRLAPHAHSAAQNSRSG